MYGISSIVVFVAYFPTIRDLWKGKPSANIHSYLLWSGAALVSLLYASLVLKDLLFSLSVGAQLLVCLIVVVLSLRIKRKR